MFYNFNFLFLTTTIMYNLMLPKKSNSRQALLKRFIIDRIHNKFTTKKMLKKTQGLFF